MFCFHVWWCVTVGVALHLVDPKSEIEKSYNEHTQHIIDKAAKGGYGNPDATKEEMQRGFNTPDQRRHKFLLSPVQAFVTQGSKWLTVGDLQQARDAAYLQSLGARATASDLSTAMIQHTKEVGLVEDVAAQNVEKLTYADNTFEYVLCKEAFHHFPRPWLALYEMLRVAQKGVVLIEPLEVGGQKAATTGDKLSAFHLSQDHELDHYEKVGNYQFRVSPREMEKTAWAMKLPHIVLKGGADHFPNESYEQFLSSVQRQIHSKQLGTSTWSFGMVAFLKEPLNATMIQSLQKQHYVVRNRPINPYTE